jgi:hypothetical protein
MVVGPRNPPHPVDWALHLPGFDTLRGISLDYCTYDKLNWEFYLLVSVNPPGGQLEFPV